jgi:rhodanese-related sulfurtransferase
MKNWQDWVLWALFAAMLARFLLARGGDRGARAAMQAGARVVDVRTRGEYASGHLPGAVNIPLHELSSRLAELGAKDRAIVVYCASGQRSSRAKGLLRGAGFTNVHNLGSISNGR